MTIKCVVACHNAAGSPDLFFCKVNCTEQDYGNGEHYDRAENEARNQGYEGPMVTFDENDGPKALFDLFVWESATTI